MRSLASQNMPQQKNALVKLWLYCDVQIPQYCVNALFTCIFRVFVPIWSTSHVFSCMQYWKKKMLPLKNVGC